MRFYRSVARLIADGCVIVRDRTGIGTAALSGGVFQNALLLRLTLEHLEERGFHVLSHRQVPCNNGGLSLGQAAVAAAVTSCD
jgi:hydrogenase maturation protein HypF